MACCNVKFKSSPPSTRMPVNLDVCKPFLVKSIANNDEKICINFVEAIGFFDPKDGAITYSANFDYVRSSYIFIRYLTKDETVTFTGEQ